MWLARLACGPEQEKCRLLWLDPRVAECRSSDWLSGHFEVHADELRGRFLSYQPFSSREYPYALLRPVVRTMYYQITDADYHIGNDLTAEEISRRDLRIKALQVVALTGFLPEITSALPVDFLTSRTWLLKPSRNEHLHPSFDSVKRITDITDVLEMLIAGRRPPYINDYDWLGELTTQVDDWLVAKIHEYHVELNEHIHRLTTVTNLTNMGIVCYLTGGVQNHISCIDNFIQSLCLHHDLLKDYGYRLTNENLFELIRLALSNERLVRAAMGYVERVCLGKPKIPETIFRNYVLLQYFIDTWVLSGSATNGPDASSCHNRCYSLPAPHKCVRLLLTLKPSRRVASEAFSHFVTRKFLVRQEDRCYLTVLHSLSDRYYYHHHAVHVAPDVVDSVLNHFTDFANLVFAHSENGGLKDSQDNIVNPYMIYFLYEMILVVHDQELKLAEPYQWKPIKHHISAIQQMFLLHQKLYDPLLWQSLNASGNGFALQFKEIIDLVIIFSCLHFSEGTDGYLRALEQLGNFIGVCPNWDTMKSKQEKAAKAIFQEKVSKIKRLYLPDAKPTKILQEMCQRFGVNYDACHSLLLEI